MDKLGDKVESAMLAADIKARSFADLVGCHYTTIYDLLKYRDTVVPLRVIQERIYHVLDFLIDAVEAGRLPFSGKLTVEEKTEKLGQLYNSYNSATSE